MKKNVYILDYTVDNNEIIVRYSNNELRCFSYSINKEIEILNIIKLQINNYYKLSKNNYFMRYFIISLFFLIVSIKLVINDIYDITLLNYISVIVSFINSICFLIGSLDKMRYGDVYKKNIEFVSNSDRINILKKCNNTDNYYLLVNENLNIKYSNNKIKKLVKDRKK